MRDYVSVVHREPCLLVALVMALESEIDCRTLIDHYSVVTSGLHCFTEKLLMTSTDGWLLFGFRLSSLFCFSFSSFGDALTPVLSSFIQHPPPVMDSMLKAKSLSIMTT